MDGSSSRSSTVRRHGGSECQEKVGHGSERAELGWHDPFACGVLRVGRALCRGVTRQYGNIFVENTVEGVRILDRGVVMALHNRSMDYILTYLGINHIWHNLDTLHSCVILSSFTATFFFAWGIELNGIFVLFSMYARRTPSPLTISEALACTTLAEPRSHHRT